jgi:hypothetical protein
MGLITIETLSELEKLLGKAYATMQGHQGDLGGTNSTARLLNKAKTLIRGGKDYPTKGLWVNDDGTMSGCPSYTEVQGPSVATGRFIAHSMTTYTCLSSDGVYEIYNQSATRYQDKNGVDIRTATGMNGKYGALLYYSALVATIAVRKGVWCNATYSEVPLPQANGYEVPIGQYIMTATGVYPTVMDVRDVGYYAPPINDEMLIHLFPVADTIDATQRTGANRAGDIVPVISALKTHIINRSGVSLKNYITHLVPTYTFSNNFIGLYAKAMNELWPTPLMKLYKDGTAKAYPIATHPVASLPVCPTVPFGGSMELVYVGSTALTATLTVSGRLIRYPTTKTLHPICLDEPIISPDNDDSIYVEDPTVLLNSTPTDAIAMFYANGNYSDSITYLEGEVKSSGWAHINNTSYPFVVNESTHRVTNGVESTHIDSIGGTKDGSAVVGAATPFTMVIPAGVTSGSVITVGSSTGRYVGLCDVTWYGRTASNTNVTPDEVLAYFRVV